MLPENQEGNENMSKKILIVEDDGNIRELLRLYLEREGYEITEASNGEEGVEQWRKVNPDMILLDVMMPIMDGWQVCKIIREESKVPIIILTAKGETFDKVNGPEIRLWLSVSRMPSSNWRSS